MVQRDPATGQVLLDVVAVDVVLQTETIATLTTPTECNAEQREILKLFAENNSMPDYAVHGWKRVAEGRDDVSVGGEDEPSGGGKAESRNETFTAASIEGHLSPCLEVIQFARRVDDVGPVLGQVARWAVIAIPGFGALSKFFSEAGATLGTGVLTE